MDDTMPRTSPPSPRDPVPVAPVRAVIPADLETPVSVFLKLEGRGAVFLLESVERGLQMGRFSFIGLDPGAEMTLQDEVVTVAYRGEGGHRTVSAPVDPADPLAAVRAELARTPLAPSPDRPLPPPLGGAVGYLGYDLVRYFDGIGLPEGGGDGLPAFHFVVPRTMVVFDHARSELEILALPDGPSVAERERAQARIEALLALLAAPLPASALRDGPRLDARPPQAEGSATGAGGRLRPDVTREEFMDRVTRAQEHILAGDAFQIVLSQRLAGPATVPPFAVYRALRILNPSPYLFYLDFGDHQLVGSSPEMLVRLHEGRLHVNPIAGTRARGDTAAADNELAADLLADAKERAEHVMLVDLGRNDLGRVCRLGSVRVDDFMTVERYSHVMHLVSRVSGDLLPGLDMFDALRATFPAGTVTGAPKIRAMQIISDLEGRSRGHYAGAVGYFGQAGDMDMCIAIRTLLRRGDTYSVQAGAGIVADSEPAREYQETLDKMGALARAVRLAGQEG
ncbi:MAG: anthranilate synthase component I [bacterium]|nr:anthranilate synthase component I [bacterium]